MASPTDRFETVLANARDTLDTAREEYDAIERTERVPQPIIQSLEGFEHELDELDDRLSVAESDVELAEETAARIRALSEVLSALRDRQRVVVDAAVVRIGQQLALLDLLDDTSDATQQARKQHSMLQQLVENDRHDRVYGNDRLSIASVEQQLRAVRFDTLAEASATDATAALRATAEALLGDVHEYLGDLGPENEDRTAFASDLKTVKERLSTIEDGDSAPETTATVVEGCLMLHYSTARAYADQRVTEALATAIAETGLTIDVGVEDCVARGAVDELLKAVAVALETKTEQSTATRLRQLVESHDGSVERTAAATEFDVAEILQQLTHLHADGAIADITVEFDS